MRLAVLITHPVQYAKPVFEALHACADLELLVVFGCDHGLRSSLDSDFGVPFAWDSSPAEGFPHRLASHVSLPALSGWFSALPVALRAVSLIQAFRPDAVLVFAYTPAFITAATLLLWLRGHRLLLRAEATDRALARSPRRQWLKDWVLRRWYGMFSHCFPIGSDSDDHFARLGVSAERRTLVRYAVDVDFFQHQVAHWLPQRAVLRRSASIPEDAVVLLWSGKITEVKNPLLLVDALAAVTPAERNRCWLLIVGEGSLRQRFVAAIEPLLPGRCLFAGFVNQQGLGRWYAMADALVFPSRQGETWGLVVNEALQFGLALLVSDHAGSARDLVAGPWPPPPGSCVFPSGDASALATAIRNVLGVRSGPSSGWNLDPRTLPHPLDLAHAVVEVTGELQRVGSRVGRPRNQGQMPT
ncbi:MAG: glycosyltransferase family 4 protein [Synechococcus sp.]